jgi:hypothetical protein
VPPHRRRPRKQWDPAHPPTRRRQSFRQK